jgi:biotin carboxyl carrier protein
MRRYQITIEGKVFEVEIVSLKGSRARVVVNGRPYEAIISAAGPAPVAAPVPPPPPKPVAAPTPPSPPRPAAAPAPERAEAATGPGAVAAPMPGVILEVLVQVGDRVETGDTVVKLEAMKMENDLTSAIAGVVSEVRVNKGDNVSVGEVLVVVSP